MSTAKNSKIVCHHVGGRGFGVTFNAPTSLKDDFVHVLYEADQDAAADMMAQSAERNVHVMPFCLGEADCMKPFHITANPYASSNYHPDPVFNTYYCEVELSGQIDGVPLDGVFYDAIYENENRVVRTVNLPVRSIDSLWKGGDLPEGLLPDFLSLDTQGAELDIINGASSVINDSVLGIATEIEFHRMYENQPLFSSVFDACVERGFLFAGFLHLQDVSTYRGPVGTRGRSFTAFGDALFLRTIPSLRNMARSPANFRLLGMKAAMIAINFGYLEYAQQILKEIADLEIKEGDASMLSDRQYNRFLIEFQEAVRNAGGIYLLTDRKDVVAHERQRQEKLSLTQKVTSHNKNSLVARIIRRLRRQVPELFTISHQDGPLERVLSDWGYLWIASEVRNRQKRVKICL